MTPEEFRAEIIPEGRRLYSLAFRFLNSREEAEDVVQDVMLKLWENRHRLEKIANPVGWATSLTRNLCIDLLRRRKRVSLSDGSDSGIMSSIPAFPAGDTDAAETAGIITRLTESMKEPYRSAVILRDIEGYSYEEAAGIMDTSVNNLRTILSRARCSIRTELEKIYSYGRGKA